MNAQTQQHTPGPWITDRPYIRSHGGNATVCEVKDGWYNRSGPQYSQEEIQANARLIAAAPELLEALQALEPFLSTQSQMLDSASLNEGRASDFDVASMKARATIAKATGAQG
ncbi:MAG: hypothetical protein ACTHMO_03900 [Rhodanobacteraceae bacterium]